MTLIAQFLPSLHPGPPLLLYAYRILLWLETSWALLSLNERGGKPRNLPFPEAFQKDTEKLLQTPPKGSAP